MRQDGHKKDLKSLKVPFHAARHVLVERCDESRCPNTVWNSHAPRFLPASELLQEDLEREYHEPLPPETPSKPRMKHMQSGTKSPPKTNTAGSTVQEVHEVDEDGEHERQVPGLHAEAGRWLEEANGAGSSVIQRTTAKWPPRPCPRCSALRQRPTPMMVTPMIASTSNCAICISESYLEKIWHHSHATEMKEEPSSWGDNAARSN